MNTTIQRTLTLLAAAAALGGCAGAPPATTLYDFGPLPAAPAARQDATPALAALVVADATGPSWLDGPSMHYRLLYADPQQSRPYAHNRWNSPPLQLLSQRLKVRLAQSGVKVLSSGDAAAGAGLLRVEVDDFAQNFDSQSQSRGQLSLRASLLRGHRLVDQRSFSRSSSAGADAAGGAKALAASADAIAADILAWLATLPPPQE